MVDADCGMKCGKNCTATQASRCVNGTCGAQPLYPGACVTEWTVDATHLYWTCQTDGTVRSAPKDGSGPVTTVASGQASPDGIAVDATQIYWASTGDGTVKAAPIVGSGATTLASGLGNITLIRVGGGFAWVMSGPALVQVPTGGGAAVTVWTNAYGNYPYYTYGHQQPDPPDQDLSIKGLAIDATNVYWSAPALVYPPAPSAPVCDPGSIYAMPLAGGKPAALGLLQPVGRDTNGPSRLVSDGKNLFGYRDYNAYPSTIAGGLYAGDCNAWDWVRGPIQGGSLQSVDAVGAWDPMIPPMVTTDTATDGTDFYWIDAWFSGGDVTRTACRSSCPSPMAGGNCPLVDLPATRIAADGAYVYIFANGTIYRTFK